MELSAQIGGGYQLVRRIGSGSFSEVWIAIAPGGIEVAVKILFRSIEHEVAQQELQSLEVVKRLRHPFLVHLQAVWVHENRLYVAMELAEQNLRTRHRECQNAGQAGIPTEELLGYFREAAEALDFLHSQKVVHRDVKPDNILLLQGHAKIGDFGLARLKEDRNANATGTGTPNYMPPEVWRGQIHEHSDQYSLAITYAEMRLGRQPYLRSSIADMMADHLERAPDLSPLGASEQQVILKALSKDPNQRYGSCRAFVEALPGALEVSKPLPIVGADATVLPGPPQDPFQTQCPSHPEVALDRTMYPTWVRDQEVRVSLGTLGPRHDAAYSNTKVVLVGDAGVGKTGLRLALIGQPFTPTESTHGRYIQTFERLEEWGIGGRAIARETMFWELAGHPGARLIHQLYLNNVAVALVVFDARSEADGFRALRNWDRVLSLALRSQIEGRSPIKKFLVGARTDWAELETGRSRIEALAQSLGFDGYFVTSAKDARSTGELAEAIRRAVDWQAQPTVSTTELFERAKAFFLAEREAGRLLSTSEDLRRAYLGSGTGPAPAEGPPDEWETCLRGMENQGLIRRLSFGSLVLLQPELLDTYASALVYAAARAPEGLASISEKDARAGRFPIPEGKRLSRGLQADLFATAVVEELLQYGIAFSEPTQDGAHLVVPSQFSPAGQVFEEPLGKAAILEYEGRTDYITAGMVVRLAHSGRFRMKELRSNGATFVAQVDGTCGILWRGLTESHGELTLFFDFETSEETRFEFEEYVNSHLQPRVTPQKIWVRRLFACRHCGLTVTEQQAAWRRQKGEKSMTCNACGEEISLLDRQERLTLSRRTLARGQLLAQLETKGENLSSSPGTAALETRADMKGSEVITKVVRPGGAETLPVMGPRTGRGSDQPVGRMHPVLSAVMARKRAERMFDVFLCHNSKDKPAVREIAEELMRRDLLPWLDEWELRPGLPWQPELEKQIARISAAAVFVGKEGTGPWQELEVDSYLREFVRRRCPVIPVLLQSTPDVPELPLFLKAMTWVDFRDPGTDPLERLVWGITNIYSPLK